MENPKVYVQVVQSRFPEDFSAGVADKVSILKGSGFDVAIDYHPVALETPKGSAVLYTAMITATE